jgi:hypothetical protein
MEYVTGLPPDETYFVALATVAEELPLFRDTKAFGGSLMAVAYEAFCSK